MNADMSNDVGVSLTIPKNVAATKTAGWTTEQHIIWTNM